MQSTVTTVTKKARRPRADRQVTIVQDTAELARQAERRRLKRLRKRQRRREQMVSVSGGQVMRGPAPRAAPNRATPGFASALDIPRNEQTLFDSIVANNPATSATEYLKTLLYPSKCSARLPDAFEASTGLVRSCTVISVPGYFTGMGADSGRFAMIVQPHLGDFSEPAKYKVAMVDASNGPSWPTNLTAANSFLAVNNGKDIRQDVYWPWLTQPQLGSASYELLLANDVNKPFGLPGQMTQTAGYNLSVIYSDASGFSEFYPPPGLYDVSMQFADATPLAGGLQITVTAVQGAQIVGGVSNVSSADGSTSSYVAKVLVPAASGGQTPGFRVTLNAFGGPDLTFSRLLIARTIDDIAGIPATSGMTKKIRPVGCSVLASYTGPVLTNGGNVAGCFLPGDAASTQFFTDGTQSLTGSLSDWQNVSSLRGAYNGPIKDGIYMWYSPTQVTDYEMYTPDQSVDYEHPNFVLAGQWTPGSIPADGSVFMRVEIWTVYEIFTDIPFLELSLQQGDTQTMDAVRKHLFGVPHVMPNAPHTSFVSRITNAFSSAAAWLWKNRMPISGLVGDAVKTFGV